MTPTITLIDVNRLKPNPNNPRKHVGDVTSLADSIRAHGIQQELVVTPIADTDDYRVVIGHRRLAAAEQAGLKQAPCKILNLTPKAERELMLIENTQRSDLTPIEEADGYQGLLDLGTTIQDMAQKTGRSTDFVRRRLKIARIPTLTRDLTADFNQLSLTDLDALAEFQDDPDTQQQLARTAGTRDWQWTLNQARETRRMNEWRASADQWIQKAGLKARKVKDLWADIDGYQYPHTWQGDQPLEIQWKRHLKQGGSPDTIILICKEGAYGYAEPLPAGTVDAKEAEDRERKEQAALERRHAAEARKFAAMSADLRCQWIRMNHTGWHYGPMSRAIETLTDMMLLGRSIYGFPRAGGDSNWEDKAITAYNHMVKTPLPVTEKNTKEGIYHLNGEENTIELRRRLDMPGSHTVQLLLLLLARREADITGAEWACKYSKQDLDIINDYYQVLETLGYQASSEETKALEGGFIDGMKEGDGHVGNNNDAE